MCLQEGVLTVQMFILVTSFFSSFDSEFLTDLKLTKYLGWLTPGILLLLPP